MIDIDQTYDYWDISKLNYAPLVLFAQMNMYYYIMYTHGAHAPYLGHIHPANKGLEYRLSSITKRS